MFILSIEEFTVQSLFYLATRRDNYNGAIPKNLTRLLFVQNGIIVGWLLRRLKPKQTKANYRGVPTHVCPCGEKVFLIRAAFDDYKISLYGLDGECVSCGALVTVPCEADADWA